VLALAVALTRAWPLASVVAGLGVPSVALAPLPGALNVMGTPLIALPDSVSVACSAVAKAVLTVVL
jgi:hypothetical protein